MPYQIGTDLPTLDNLAVQDPTAREGSSSRSKSRPQNLHILAHLIQLNMSPVINGVPSSSTIPEPDRVGLFPGIRK